MKKVKGQSLLSKKMNSTSVTLALREINNNYKKQYFHLYLDLEF